MRPVRVGAGVLTAVPALGAGAVWADAPGTVVASGVSNALAASTGDIGNECPASPCCGQAPSLRTYITLDLQLGWQNTHWLAALDVFNALDAKWNDIEYFHVSRTRNESYAQAGYVIHPGVPRTLRAHVEYRF